MGRRGEGEKESFERRLVMAEQVEVVAEEKREVVKIAVESPPGTEIQERREEDPRVKLLQMADVLMRSQNRKLLVEYLRLRRALR
jgi:hypothetical protein